VNKTRARVATGAVALGLAGLAGIALGASHQQADVATRKPLVRTKVIHRTIHVTKHAKPRHPSGAGSRPGSASRAGGVTTGSSSVGSTESSGSSAVTTSSSGAASTGSEAAAPVVTQTSGSAGPSSESSAPVTTATSGGGSVGGSGGGEEHEGRDD
jgi:hypothetical protein